MTLPPAAVTRFATSPTLSTETELPRNAGTFGMSCFMIPPTPVSPAFTTVTSVVISWGQTNWPLR
jgi:hypothetical protein